MWARLAWLAAGAVLGAGLMFAQSLRTASVEPVPENISLEASFAELSSAITGAGSFVQQHTWYGSPIEQAEAYRHILRTLVTAIELHGLADSDFPFFYEIDPFSKGGMDNTDQRYLMAMLDGAAQYRVWGSRGSSRRLDLSLYPGMDAMASSIATLTTESLELDADGNFEVIIGGAPQPGNWMPGHSGPMRLLVRQIHADWNAEQPGNLHIDRIDGGRPDYPALQRGKMAKQLRAATDAFAADLRRSRFAALMPVNTLTPPRDTGTEGGLRGRWMVGGHFDLAADEALLITAAPTEAAYQGVQFGNHWWASLDYANRQSSLTFDQSRVSSDGRLYYVVSAADPGTANWLDTEGYTRGVMLLRYDGLHRSLSAEEAPRAQVIKLLQLRDYLPEDEPRISAEQRAAVIAARRAHVQRRFGF